jgi:hypothetical protein
MCQNFNPDDELDPDYDTREQFSVYQFFPDTTYERVLSFVPLKKAEDKVLSLTRTVGAYRHYSANHHH